MVRNCFELQYTLHAPRVPASPAARAVLQCCSAADQTCLFSEPADNGCGHTAASSICMQWPPYSTAAGYSPGIVWEVLRHVQVHGDVVPVVRVAAHPLPLHHVCPAPAITGHNTADTRYTGYTRLSRHQTRLGFLERARASCSSPLQSAHVLVTRTTAASTTIMRAACSPTVHPAPPPAPAPHNPTS